MSSQRNRIFATKIVNYQSIGSKSSLPTPHTGQSQSSGISSNEVPGAIPPSGSPSTGSYT